MPPKHSFCRAQYGLSRWVLPSLSTMHHSQSNTPKQSLKQYTAYRQWSKYFFRDWPSGKSRFWVKYALKMFWKWFYNWLQFKVWTHRKKTLLRILNPKIHLPVITTGWHCAVNVHQQRSHGWCVVYSFHLLVCTVHVYLLVYLWLQRVLIHWGRVSCRLGSITFRLMGSWCTSQLGFLHNTHSKDAHTR